MRAREQEELSVLRRGVVELDAELQERAHHRVAAEAVVDVPTEVTVSLHDVRVLHEHHRSVEPIVADTQVGAREVREPQETFVEVELVDHS
jgi:hypothetical protein